MAKDLMVQELEEKAKARIKRFGELQDNEAKNMKILGKGKQTSKARRIQTSYWFYSTIFYFTYHYWPIRL